MLFIILIHYYIHGASFESLLQLSNSLKLWINLTESFSISALIRHRTCLKRSSVRMFSTAKTLRKYFSIAASLSEDLGFSALAATRANISRSSELWLSCWHTQPKQTDESQQASQRSLYDAFGFHSDFNEIFHMLTPGMLETTSKVTPQPGMVLLVDILLRKFWAKPYVDNKRRNKINSTVIYEI